MHVPGLSLRSTEPEFLKSGSQKSANLTIFPGDSCTLKIGTTTYVIV